MEYASGGELFDYIVQHQRVPVRLAILRGMKPLFRTEVKPATKKQQNSTRGSWPYY